MTKKLFSFLFIFLAIRCLGQTGNFTPVYTVANAPWADSLGNHRLVVQVVSDKKGNWVGKAKQAVEVKVDWRRRDLDADRKVILVTDQSGHLIENVAVKSVNRETGDFVFEPIAGQGIYYVYYMPWHGEKLSGQFVGDYLHIQPPAQAEWLSEIQNGEGKNGWMVQHLEIQSRTAFDSFFPMEVVAKHEEVSSLLAKYPNEDFLLFPEDRTRPIRMFNDLPLRWIRNGPQDHFEAKASPNEYFVFQVGIWAAGADLKELQVRYKDAPFSVTCFNLSGVDPEGTPFQKDVSVPKGGIQPLWFGVDIPAKLSSGSYSFTVYIKAKNRAEQPVHVQIEVAGAALKDRGDSQLWRMSRLRWLNSKLGINDLPTSAYLPIRRNGLNLKVKSAEITLSNTGLPAAVAVHGNELLAAPVDFILQTNTGIAQRPLAEPADGRVEFNKSAAGLIGWERRSECRDYSMVLSGQLESDGYLHYKIHILPKKDFWSMDASLNLHMKKTFSTYFMGMGYGRGNGMGGGKTPGNYQWKWKGPQNSFWTGNYNGGIYCKLLGATYTGPLLNLYHPLPPPSWYNLNAGGFKLISNDHETRSSVYSGKRLFKKDSAIDFEFSLLVTPVKELDTKEQFTMRYFHDARNPFPPKPDLDMGVKVINVHHANQLNPYINYPFISTQKIKAFADSCHEAGMKMKLYYTIRELSTQCAEIWAFRSLGTEIFSDGNGGGYPWLREHLVNHYDVQWFTPIEGYEACDAAIRTNGRSRLYNYYIEGLHWLVQKTGIDGLYLDDVAFGRDMLKRMRKVMELVKPGCMIDLHSNTGFSKGPATQYADYFPFIDKLWFGESFDYESMQPDNWLVESSGIPFGLMGDMLYRGGNPWRGMVYGMTNRDGWETEGVICNPKPIWKAMDRFGIKTAKMIGYWENMPVVQTSDKDIRATAYIKGNKLLIAVASWKPVTASIKLSIDWQQLGFTPKKQIADAWKIDGFQPSGQFSLTEEIPVEPGRGWLLEIE